MAFYKYFLLSALLMASLRIQAQNREVDSLLNVLPQTTDTTRFNTLSKLFWKTFDKDPHKAKKYLDEERELVKELNLEIFTARSYNDLGVYYWTQSRLDSSILSFKKALDIYENVDDILGINSTLNNLGNLYADKGDYESSVDYYMRSMKIKDELNDERGLAISYMNIANVYGESGNWNLASQYYDKCLDISLTLSDSSMIARCYGGLGVINSNKGDFRESIVYHLKSLDINRKIGDRYMEAINRENIGNAYSRLNEYDSSLTFLEQAKKINESLGNRYSLAINCRSIGFTYKGKKMYQKALDYLHQSLAIAGELTAMSEVMNGYKILSEVYEDKHDFSSALRYHKMYIALKDSLLSEETKLKINDLEISYQTEKKEKEIAQQNLEIETLKQAALIQDFRKKWLVTGLVAAVVLSGFIFYGQKQRMKRQKVESEKRQLEIENELSLRKKELASHTLHLVQKNELLDEINIKLKELKKAPEIHQKEISKIIQRIKSDKIADADWDNFKMYFDQVHEDFDRKLKEYFNDLTTNEIRLAALMKMKLSTKEIASILNISPDSVNKARYRLRKKLNMNSDDRLEDFILAL